MLARQDPELAAILERASLVSGDGAGVVWASRFLGTPLPERVTGIDLAEALLAWTGSRRKGFRFFFLGARPGVAERAAKAIQERFPRAIITGWEHGYFALGSDEERGLIRRINAARPDILLVAMGAPRQEKWIARRIHGPAECGKSTDDADCGNNAGGACGGVSGSRVDDRECLKVPVAIGIGGSFDVWAGVAKRAPGWVQSLNLEWAYRLAREPARWKRVGALPLFVLAVMGEKARHSRGEKR